MGGGKKGGSGKALAAQINAANSAMRTQKEQFNYIKGLMKPYATGGKAAFNSQLDLLGLGDGSQQEAIDDLTNQDYFQTLLAQGEEAILQNASATGGLRGGNTQGALAQFRPSMISQLVQQQLANLGGITQTGMMGANTLANASTNYANAIGEQQTNIGNATANRQLAKAQEGGGFGSVLGAGLSIAGAASGLGWAPFAAKAVGAAAG